MSTGPSLDTLLRRLLDTPPDFLDTPRCGSHGQLQVAAVVGDAFSVRGLQMDASLRAALSGNSPGVSANQLSLSAIMAWLMVDELWDAFTAAPDGWAVLFSETVPALAASAPAERFVLDPDRREELARSLVARLDLLPEGETHAQASDRLARVSGVERRRLLDASRAAEARARAIREALARKAAEESADKWTRE